MNELFKTTSIFLFFFSFSRSLVLKKKKKKKKHKTQSVLLSLIVYGPEMLIRCGPADFLRNDPCRCHFQGLKWLFNILDKYLSCSVSCQKRDKKIDTTFTPVLQAFVWRQETVGLSWHITGSRRAQLACFCQKNTSNFEQRNYMI